MPAEMIPFPVPAASPAPTSRVQAVDALRGLALVGMLLVHFQYYVHDEGLWSQRVNATVDFLAVDRFYPLFAFLFGTGFALQLARWEQRGDFVKIYLRRLAALMLFAAVFIATTGYQVLETYAFWGIALLLVRRWSNRALVIAVLVCSFTRPATHLVLWQWERTHFTSEQANARVTAESRTFPDYIREQDRLRDEGRWPQLISIRLRHAFGDYLNVRHYIPGDPLIMFLLGMLCVRLRVLQEPLRHRKLLIAVIMYGALAGVASTLIAHYWGDVFASQRLNQALRTLFYGVVNEQFQGLAYAAVLLLLAAHARASGFIDALAAPGRLSLTNYVVQVVILETLFATSHPLIPLNRWGGLTGVAIVFAAQVWFSRWWMSRYRYGPLEWLWRSATFARWQPLRREQAHAAAA